MILFAAFFLLVLLIVFGYHCFLLLIGFSDETSSSVDDGSTWQDPWDQSSGAVGDDSSSNDSSR